METKQKESTVNLDRVTPADLAHASVRTLVSVFTGLICLAAIAALVFFVVHFVEVYNSCYALRMQEYKDHKFMIDTFCDVYPQNRRSPACVEAYKYMAGSFRMRVMEDVIAEHFHHLPGMEYCSKGNDCYNLMMHFIDRVGNAIWIFAFVAGLGVPLLAYWIFTSLISNAVRHGTSILKDYRKQQKVRLPSLYGMNANEIELQSPIKKQI